MITFTTSGSLVDIKQGTSSGGFNVIRSINSNSKNITWSYGSDVSRIDFAIDDLTFDSIPANQISFDGVALSDATGFKAAVEAMFPNLAATPGGGSYLVYTANAVHNGSAGVPTITVMYGNSVGDIIWTYVDVGEYEGTLSDTFTEGKTICFPRGDAFDDDGDEAIYLSLRQTSTNTVSLRCFSALNGGNRKELNTSIPVPLEIRVYQ